jgi:hypothetical protein
MRRTDHGCAYGTKDCIGRIDTSSQRAHAAAVLLGSVLVGRHSAGWCVVYGELRSYDEGVGGEQGSVIRLIFKLID